MTYVRFLKIAWKSRVLNTAAEVHAFEGSGHYAFWEESDEFNAALHQWLLDYDL